MHSENELHTLIIHGTGVEGTAALNWFLDRSPAQIIVIGREEDLAALAAGESAKNRLTCQTETTFCSNPLPGTGPVLYLRSPGIPPTNPVFEKIRAAGLPHTTPTGYWLARHAPEQLITITGTKGKSSTASLTALVLQWAGLKAEAMGNIGRTPFEARPSPETICIFELSSYMMHDLPPVSSLHVVTSLYREHTDWHGSHEAYAQDKLRSFFTTPPSQGLVTKDIARRLPADQKNITFLEEAAPMNDGVLSLGTEDINITPASLNDTFNAPSLLLALRAAAAICLTKALLSSEELKSVLEQNLPDWQGLPNRQQIIPSTDGIVWVDDALATVPEATLSALGRWQDSHVHLLLGGKDRGQDFTALLRQCEARGSTLTVYSFDETDRAVQQAAGKCPVVHCASLAKMIETAAGKAQPGDIILFSPAASSAPPFANYRERSAVFQGFIPKQPD